MSNGGSAFLLVTGPGDDYWRATLEAVLAPLGKLVVAEEESAMEKVLRRGYLAIIVDASAVEEFSLLVSRIRAQSPWARVIVATASPKWESAREAFRAGATDYIQRSLDKEELLAALHAALAKPVLPWPR